MVSERLKFKVIQCSECESDVTCVAKRKRRLVKDKHGLQKERPAMIQEKLYHSHAMDSRCAL